ncbi:glycosyl hydrolase family 47 [Necator americanus]|uniref:alpha-1,2-Mannosidase n=1 Tax=Necator americanus TaxID=51031 RepID=W2SKN6_NECAM|nr:glycosyl hydrolase family 47 [Necator americanus]ETN69272.1 glycosyl hydrolase family 47 [Necator americanus]
MVFTAKRISSPNKTSVPTFEGPTNDRQRAVVAAFKHAWEGYKKFAWGHDQLKPVSGGYSDWFNTGLTIVDALDTAIIMGLKGEVAQGTEWIRDSLSFEKDIYVNLFETTIRTLGGLLSAYHLTGDRMFIAKAEDLGKRLIVGFTSSKSAVPLSDVNLKTRKAKTPPWSSESSLSEVTSLQLEFRDLSRVTGKSVYEQISFKVSTHIHDIGCGENEGLCDMYLNSNTGKFRSGTTITFGARADSYYEYLLKQWLQTGKTIDWLLSDYATAMESMQSKLLRYSEPSKLPFVGELLPGAVYSPKMDHLACFLAGTLALGSRNGLPDGHMKLAEVIITFSFLQNVSGIGKACQAMYKNPTGLGPEIVYFNMLPGQHEDLSIKPLDAHSLLRPEAIEAWFYLYRLTGDKMYQDWGWQAFQAIEQYARVKNGYSSVKSVKKIPVSYRDLMESFFLAETLKYLFLLFADDQNELFPLDRWVFNTEAHPLPIYDH